VSEDKTREHPDARPSEERVLTMLTEMRSDFNARLEKLEAKQYDTRPIWERALAEIVETRAEIGGVRAEIAEVKRQFEDFDVRLDRVESIVNAKRGEMLTLRADFKEFRALQRAGMINFLVADPRAAVCKPSRAGKKSRKSLSDVGQNLFRGRLSVRPQWQRDELLNPHQVFLNSDRPQFSPYHEKL